MLFKCPLEAPTDLSSLGRPMVMSYVPLYFYAKTSHDATSHNVL